MPRPIASLVFIVCAGCLAPDADPVQSNADAEVVAAADRALAALDVPLYGLPEGVEPAPPFDGVYPEPVLNDPVNVRATAAFAHAVMAIDEAALTAPTWQAADRAVRELAATPPPEAAAAPPYLVEQAASLALLRRDDFWADPPTGASRRAARHHLDVLLANRTPDLALIARLIERAGDALDPDARAAASAQALDAADRHLDRVLAERETYDCEGCPAVIRDAPERLLAEWEGPRRDLRALAAQAAR